MEHFSLNEEQLCDNPIEHIPETVITWSDCVYLETYSYLHLASNDRRLSCITFLYLTSHPASDCLTYDVHNAEMGHSFLFLSQRKTDSFSHSVVANQISTHNIYHQVVSVPGLLNVFVMKVCWFGKRCTNYKHNNNNNSKQHLPQAKLGTETK